MVLPLPSVLTDESDLAYSRDEYGFRRLPQKKAKIQGYVRR